MATSSAGRLMSIITTATTSGGRSKRCRNTICRRRIRPNSSAPTPAGSTRYRRRPESSATASPRSSAPTGGRPTKRSAPRCGPRHRSAEWPPNRHTQHRTVEAAMPSKDFSVFDSDSHVVELPTLWDKYLDPEYRTLGKHALWRHEGSNASYLKVNGEI